MAPVNTDSSLKNKTLRKWEGFKFYMLNCENFWVQYTVQYKLIGSSVEFELEDAYLTILWFIDCRAPLPRMPVTTKIIKSSVDLLYYWGVSHPKFIKDISINKLKGSKHIESAVQITLTWFYPDSSRQKKHISYKNLVANHKNCSDQSTVS